MERCGFFDAYLSGEDYDRVYLAQHFAAYFASFIGNGVYAEHSNQLEVMAMPTPQMQVSVQTGQGWINGYWYENTDSLYLPIDVADGVLNRIDSIVLRFGTTERNMWIAVKKGVAAINPVAPEVTRNADYYELQLATVSVPAGVISITQARITDTRLDQSVCGWVTGVIQQIDTTTLFNQFESYFDEFKQFYENDYASWTAEQKHAYITWVTLQENDYTNWTDEQKAEYDAWYASHIDLWQNEFTTWFENMKGQLSTDAAGKIQVEIDEHEARLDNIENIPELAATTDLSENDLIIVELVNGGTRKMAYGDLVTTIKASLSGGGDSILTIANISSIQTEDGNMVPASALIKSMNDLGIIMFREQKAAYGYFGIEQNIDELMEWVRAGNAWDKFAIGDYIVDTKTTGEKVMWEVADKNGYLHCGDTPLESSNIILVPRDCFNTQQQYNTSNINAGGFASSTMHAKLVTEMNTFSAKLRGYMTEIRRLENNKGNWAWATREICLPSIVELTGNTGFADRFANVPICHSLALFTGGNAHLSKGSGFNKAVEARTKYWTQDPSGYDTTGFCDISSHGYSNFDSATSTGGIVPLIVLS